MENNIHHNGHKMIKIFNDCIEIFKNVIIINKKDKYVFNKSEWTEFRSPKLTLKLWAEEKIWWIWRINKKPFSTKTCIPDGFIKINE